MVATPNVSPLLQGEQPFVGTRQAARDAGARYYINPKRSCKIHQPTVRLVSTTACVQCAWDYHAQNKAKIRNRKRYYEQENRDTIKAKQAEKYLKNREYMLRRQKERDALRMPEKLAYMKEWASHNKEYLAAYYEKWRLENPDKVTAKAHNRRARKLNAPGVCTGDDMKVIWAFQDGKCVYCRQDLEDDHQLDHWVPLAKGGSNERTNMQWACERQNKEKADRDPLEYEASIGFVRTYPVGAPFMKEDSGDEG